MEAALEVFRDWLAQNGVKVDYESIRFVHENVCHGYGVRAVKDLPESHVVCEIPKSSVLSIRTSPLSEILQVEEIEGGLGTAIALMRELSLKENSRWHGYLQTFPAHVPLPLFWSASELESLRGTCLETATLQERQHLQADYDQYVRPLVEKHPAMFPAPIALEDYLRAVAYVSSRAFLVDGHHGDSMVPVADIFNHRTDAEHVHIEGDDAADKAGPEDAADSDNEDGEGNGGGDGEAKEAAAGHDAQQLEGSLGAGHVEAQAPVAASADKGDSKDSLDIRVFRPANAGEEIFNTFGELPNSALLSKYGFAEPDNAHDAAFMPAELVRAVLIARLGEALVRDNLDKIWEANPDVFGPDASDAYEVAVDGSVNEALMLMLYSAHVSKDLRKKWEEDNVALMEHVANVDMNQILDVPGVCDTLTELFKARVMQYPPSTSLDSDQKRATALAAKGLTNLSEAELKEYFALLVRVGERKVLKRAYESVFDVSESKEASSSYKPHNADSSQQKRQQTDQGKARQGKKKRRR